MRHFRRREPKPRIRGVTTLREYFAERVCLAYAREFDRPGTRYLVRQARRHRVTWEGVRHLFELTLQAETGETLSERYLQ